MRAFGDSGVEGVEQQVFGKSEPEVVIEPVFCNVGRREFFLVVSVILLVVYGTVRVPVAAHVEIDGLGKPPFSMTTGLIYHAGGQFFVP